MKSPVDRTLDLFPGIPGPKSKPKKPSTRVLRKELVKTALDWCNGKAEWFEVRLAAEMLQRAMEKGT